MFFPPGHCLQETASERVPKESCYVRNPDQQEKKQDTESALFQGNTHLVPIAGEATSSAWNQPKSQAVLMQITSSIVRPWYQLPHIAA